MNEVCLILRRFHCNWDWFLSEESPDWYDYYDDVKNVESIDPPLDIRFVKAGARFGWRWSTGFRSECELPCEINWFDPEPEKVSFCSSEEYEKYTEELRHLEEKIDVFRGYYEPPTEEEYIRLCEKYYEEEEDDDAE